MSVVDSQGRLFGRINLIDAAVLVLLVLLLPLAYAASLMFQPARARIDSVGRVDITNAERRIVAGGSLLSAKLKVRGTGFNPMLRAYIDDSPALAFVFENPNSADVLVGPLGPGPHDLILYDGVQEVARAKGAVTVDQQTSRAIRAAGWLTSLAPSESAELKVGLKFPPGGLSHEIMALGPERPASSRIRFGQGDADYPVAGRVERQAVVVLQCDPRGDEFWYGQEPCTVGGQGVLGTPPVIVALPGASGTFRFAVDELFPTTPPRVARIQVRVNGGPEAGLVKAGDRDALLDQRAAVVASASGRLLTIDLGLDESREGWRYRGRLVRPGASFVLATDRYEITGQVESMSVRDAGDKGSQ